MIFHFLDSADVGGIETHVETLALAQNAAGQQTSVMLWKRHEHRSTIKRFAASGLRVIDAGGNFFALCRILRRERPAILHTHGYKANILGRFAARLCGVRSVSTYHAGERGPFPVNLYQTLDEKTGWLGSAISVSRPIAETLPFASTVIANFVAVPQLETDLSPGDTITFAGRFSYEKAPDLFCKIAEMHKRRAKFAAYGDGPLLAGLREEYVDAVDFRGFAPDMNSVWRHTGLLLMPSRNEGLPMAALEAMARGIPVAASAAGALPDVIKDGVDGFLFAPGDLHGAAAAVERWFKMTAKERQLMGDAARRTIAQRFSTERGLREVADVYARA